LQTQRERRRGCSSEDSRRQLHPSALYDLRKFARTDRGIRDEIEKPAHVGQKRPPVGIADIEWVDRLETKPRNVRDDRDQSGPQQSVRQERTSLATCPRLPS
jgi:hypothetical protein